MTGKEIADHFSHIEAAIELAATPEETAELRDALSLLARFAYHKLTLQQARIAEDAEEIEYQKRHIERLSGRVNDALAAMETK